MKTNKTFEDHFEPKKEPVRRKVGKHQKPSLAMKILIGIFILTFGVVALGFAQGEKKERPTTKDLKSNQPQLLDSLQVLDFDSWNGLHIDSTRIFRPEGLFQEKYLKMKPQLFEIPSPGIYPLPDPQSRMPIKTFDDSVNYTILRKEYK